MSKIVTVIGATGIQGGSVIRAILKDSNYTIRALTRNVESSAAVALRALGVEVIQGDLNDINSLRVAFDGSYAIFAVTNFFENIPTLSIKEAMEKETRLGINLAEAAASTKSLVHYVWSTLPNSRKNTSGNIVVPFFESKNAVDEYIKTKQQELLAKTTFLRLGWYASNMSYPWFKPSEIHTADGSNVHLQVISMPPSVTIPLLGCEKVNIGLFVKAILDHPEKTLPARTVAGFAEKMSWKQMVHCYAKAHEIEVRCARISKEDYRALWPVWGELMDVANDYYEYVGARGMLGRDEEEDVLGSEELGMEGLVGIADAFARMKSVD
ncbi:hypothetical protein B0T12DRAFT_353935 [Alternaria alternata]|jgi:hypothetical protein|nr:hypothetical protein B0T12DRAFT_353935 [Alternaria alternata]